MARGKEGGREGGRKEETKLNQQDGKGVSHEVDYTAFNPFSLMKYENF